MGYLDNSSVIVDAILTNKGRQVMAAGGQLNIVKFALSDDEIDYDLWNPAHTLGTNYYGAIIENMPILEGLPDESQMMRYKLVTLPKDVVGIPVISVAPNAVSFTSLTQEVTITPTTINLAGGNSSAGYTAILSDDTVAELTVAPSGEISTLGNGGPKSLDNTGFIDDHLAGQTTAGKTVSVIGSKFIIKAKPQSDLTTTRRALLTIVGNETGGFKTVSVTVDPSGFSTLDVESSLPVIPVTPRDAGGPGSGNTDTLPGINSTTR